MKRTRTAGPAHQAKLPTPFALLGIRTEGDVLAEITLLQRVRWLLAHEGSARGRR